ncbi:MAG TPA: dUTP diphosphatase [Candidatus Cryosericum sp.]|nr:dUTP diphosphatase [Candidatus Cryosericum sp.]
MPARRPSARRLARTPPRGAVRPEAGASVAGADSSRALSVPIIRLPGNDDLPLPERATAGSAGFDLRACVVEPVILAPGSRALIPTGFALALPPGFEGQVRPRSGLALRQGLTLLNSPGTIDSDYRGEISVVAVNLGQEAVTIRRGDRIAQLVIAPVAPARLVLAPGLSPSRRGPGGFGHTGTH